MLTRKKILYVILDGLSDLPLKELDNKTPLESAYTPHMDRLAQSGKTGLVRSSLKGVAPESDISVLGLLGYDLDKYYCGRGPLECFSAGLPIEDGNLALRGNFATVGPDGRSIIDRRVARSLSSEEAQGLSKELNSKITLSNAVFEFKNTIGHRAVLKICGIRSKLSGRITNTDPAYERKGLFSVAVENFSNTILDARAQTDYETSQVALESASLVNEWTVKAQEVLQNSSVNKKRIAEGKLPANAVLLRDAGDHLPDFPKITDTYKLKFGAFVDMPLERGIAMLTGMDIIDAPKPSGHLDVDLAIWAKVALDALDKYDGIYVHLKGVDEPGHDGDFLRKREIIEKIDKFFFSALMENLEMKNTIMAVTSDHSTVCAKKAHYSCSVPLFICGAQITPDGTMSFSERAAKLGSLGELKSQDILPLVVNLTKK